MGIRDWLKPRRQPTKPKAPRGTGSSGFLGEDEVQDFVYGGELLFVSSSNVAAAQYHHDERTLMVEFLHDGAAYLYSDVSVEEAESFARAASKGSWVWDCLRVRGTADQHRKPYVRLR